MPVTEFKVERSKWLRGDDVESLLYRDSDGLFCCLGMLGLACGATPEDMNGYGCPESCTNIEWPRSIVTTEVDDGFDDEMGDTDLTAKIITVNDNPELDDASREAQLTELFAQGGIKVTFVD